MAVKLRLRRMGKKKQPFYRIVAADSRAPRDGRFIELIGTYDPIKQPHEINVKEERVLYWLNNGAQPTRTVQNLLSQLGLWMKWDLLKRGVDEAKIAQELAKFELVRKEKAQRQAEKAAAQKSVKQAAKEEAAEAEETPVEAEEAPVETAAEPASQPEAAVAAEETAAEAETPAEAEKSETDAKAAAPEAPAERTPAKENTAPEEVVPEDEEQKTE